MSMPCTCRTLSQTLCLVQFLVVDFCVADMFWQPAINGSQVPLYPAATVWRQLINEEKSRINACKGVRLLH